MLRRKTQRRQREKSLGSDSTVEIHQFGKLEKRTKKKHRSLSRCFLSLLGVFYFILGQALIL
ncbi:hypothetical protein MtrunA17_Chr7g0228521 [Medicago truncatula]|uniref:Transmembrane protein n=1 Tax=Medicago truncatula TaxID=3880 RepID=A0A396GVY9_MEDTR|nr:hypothetical protein MtrunA17_Chr7g0228521 [Medicago truncatula]